MGTGRKAVSQQTASGGIPVCSPGKAGCCGYPLGIGQDGDAGAGGLVYTRKRVKVAEVWAAGLRVPNNGEKDEGRKNHSVAAER